MNEEISPRHPADVSVVIANYNYGAFVGEAIESVLGQSGGTRIETIVVDDGSTDDSLDVIRRYPVTLVSQRNAGVCAARNVGAMRAAGEFLMFLDADDVLEPDYVVRCVHALRNSSGEVAYAYTQMRLFGTVEGMDVSRPFDRVALLKGNFVNASALMRRAIFVAVGGFDPGFGHGYEDYELWMRLLSRGYVGILVAAPLLRYRRHSASRNSLAPCQIDVLTWQIRGLYPWLCRRWLLCRPFRFLFWTFRQRRIRSSRRMFGIASLAGVSGAGRQ